MGGMKMALKKRKALGITGFAGIGLFASMAINACGGETVADEQCVSNEQFFKENVMPIASGKCMACHTTQGQAQNSSLIFQDSNWGPDYIEQNMKVFEQLSKLRFEGKPWILVKPTNEIAHEGAVQFEAGSEEYEVFQAMIERIDDPVACDDSDAVEEFFENVELLDEVATLRKASLALVGRLPTLDEETRVRDGGFEALDAVLDSMMTEEAFYDRLIEIYNDDFLTDRYYPGTEALGLLGGLEDMNEDPIYPNLFWYEEEFGGAENEDVSEADQAARDEAADFANKGIARASLELIAYIVRNNRPYTEVLTADFTMVNPYSAKSYGVSPDFETGEYDEFVPAKLPGIPHAGVLTDPIFMNRFPTTPTNRNRHRSRIVYEIFLATDVQRLGERPVDATKIEGFNPTMNDANCTVCHSIIDPLAGSFKNWNEAGYYSPGMPSVEQPIEGKWYTDMRQPGFGDVTLPAEQDNAAAAWVAQQIVQDNRFAISPIHILFKGLSGQTPLREPSDPKAPGYLEGIRAHDVQTKLFQEIADQFVESNYNLKVAIKELIKSPYYRASNAFDLSESRQLELGDVGTGRLLTPEQLDRKITAVTGIPWTTGDEDHYLLSSDQYRIFYGGIDSNDVIERVTETNGIMANTAARMANEMACSATAQDFALDPSERKLFPFVETTFEPEDANGFEVSASALAIRSNLRHLHWRFLGEDLSENDPEIDRTYRLFLDLWKNGRSGLTTEVPEGEPNYYQTGLGNCSAQTNIWTGEEYPEGKAIVNDESYTVRAWMGVISYLLQDYRFLHE